MSKSSLSAPRSGLTFRQFLDRFIRVPHERLRRLAPLTLHPEQARVVDAVDATDATTGLRQYRELVLSWCKKSGKSTTLAALALYMLVADQFSQDREVVLVASDLSQSKDVVFASACRMVQRHEWLRQHCDVKQTEIHFRERVTDATTGGSWTQTHVLRAVPRDPRGLHGQNQSCTIHDEVWTADDYAVFEALAPSPARRCPLTVYASYAGLRVQQRPGVPWFDVVARGRRGDDGSLFFSELAGAAGWQQVPWITPRWVQSMQRTLPESMFTRLVLNQPASSESAFLSAAEVADAVDPDLREPLAGSPGVSYVAALDLGISYDWTGFVLGHTNEQSQFVVDLVRFWRGTRQQPVSLELVEETVAALARRFPLSLLQIDQWQAIGLHERLMKRGLPAKLVTIEPTRLDKLTTLTKTLFSQRLVRLPADQHELISQLENLNVAEVGAKNRRRDLLRFQPGGVSGAAAHDDLAICLALCLDAAPSLGRPQVDPMPHGCYQEQNGRSAHDCYLADGTWVGLGDWLCKSCPGHASVQRHYQAYLARGHEWMDVRQYLKTQIRPNAWMLARRVNSRFGWL